MYPVIIGLRTLAACSAIILATAGGIQHVSASPPQVPAEQPQWATVIKPFGAALRSTPNGETGYNVMMVAECGSAFPVTGRNGGWIQVYVDIPGPRSGEFAWVGGARVHVGPGYAPHLAGPCAETFQIGDLVETEVASGCLSIRLAMSASAPYNHCVPNGTVLTIANGPFEAEGLEWFEVWSPSTRGGWSRAQFLRGY